MDNSVTLARAFIYRKRFSKIVNKAEALLTSRAIFSEESEVNALKERKKRLAFDELLAFYEKAQDHLVKINTEMDLANNCVVDGRTPRSYINELEGLKERLKLYLNFAEKADKYRATVEEFDEHVFNPKTKELGCKVEKKYVMNTSRDFEAGCLELRKKIRIAEDNLAVINARVFLATGAEYWDAALEELEKF